MVDRYGLTPREKEILEALIECECNRALVQKNLHIERATLKTHLVHIYEKFGVSDLAAVMVRYLTTASNKGNIVNG